MDWNQETILSENWKHRQDLRRKKKWRSGSWMMYRSHRNLFSITAGSVLQAEAEIILFQRNLIFPLKRQMKRKIHFLVQYLHFITSQVR